MCRPNSVWEGDIKTRLKESGSEDMDWFYLPQDRNKPLAVVNTVMNIRILSFCDRAS